MSDQEQGRGRPVQVVEADLVAEIVETLNAVPAERRQAMAAILYQRQDLHIGPLPDPATFAAYGQVYADAPREILAMAVKQQDHDIDMRSRMLTSEIGYRRETLYTATIAFLCIIAGATALGITGHEIAAGVMGRHRRSGGRGRRSVARARPVSEVRSFRAAATRGRRSGTPAGRCGAPERARASAPGQIEQARQEKEQRDVTILRSLPGVGRNVIATLLAEASEALQRRDYQALRCLSGVAAVTKPSGKSCIVLIRQAADVRLRNAVYYWARVAARHDPICKARYTALRSRRHGHARALRSVADRLLGVACAMLKNQSASDPKLTTKAA